MFVEHKEAIEVTEAPAKLKKLSQAVLEGSKLRGQCRGAWATRGKSCALVAACEATGMPYREESFHSGAIFRHLNARFPAVPSDVYHHIPTLMDDEGMTREEVAAWLESQGL